MIRLILYSLSFPVAFVRVTEFRSYLKSLLFFSSSFFLSHQRVGHRAFAEASSVFFHCIFHRTRVTYCLRRSYCPEARRAPRVVIRVHVNAVGECGASENRPSIHTSATYARGVAFRDGVAAAYRGRSSALPLRILRSRTRWEAEIVIEGA